MKIIEIVFSVCWPLCMSSRGEARNQQIREISSLHQLSARLNSRSSLSAMYVGIDRSLQSGGSPIKASDLLRGTNCSSDNSQKEGRPKNRLGLSTPRVMGSLQKTKRPPSCPTAICGCTAIARAGIFLLAERCSWTAAQLRSPSAGTGAPSPGPRPRQGPENEADGNAGANSLVPQTRAFQVVGSSETISKVTAHAATVATNAIRNRCSFLSSIRTGL